MTIARAIIISAIIGIVLPAIFLTAVMRGSPNTGASVAPSGPTSRQALSKPTIPDSGLDQDHDPWPDEWFQHSYDSDVADDQPDGGQDAFPTELKVDPFLREFDRLTAAAHDDLENQAVSGERVPSGDRYCWNVNTAEAASFALRKGELQRLIASDTFVGFPMICPSQFTNH